MAGTIVKTCKFHGELTSEDCYSDSKGRTNTRFRCKACSISQTKEWDNRNASKVIARHKQKRIDDRLKVLVHYSKSDKPFCECCGDSNLEFLALDHKDGGGTKHRQEVGKHMFAWAIKNNYPPMFRVLCHNCNISIGLYGYCPHQAALSS